MKTASLFACCALSVSASPAKEALAELRKTDPEDPQKWAQDILARVPVVEPGTAKVLVIGDSWADVIAVGGNESFFEKKLKDEHGCDVSSYCIAIPGSTSGTWTTKAVLATLTAAVKSYQPDYVWMTLVGNDALDRMPGCAKTGQSESQCADDLLAFALPNVYKIVDTVHEAKPDARVLGLGYDAMFGGFGCSLVTHDVFPQCWNGSVPKGQENRCFNTQLIRIQQGMDWIAGNRSFVDQVSILGATQVAAGDPKASTDPNDRHIDLDKMGPAKYWPDYLGCFHPGIAGGDDSGAMVLMEEFHKVYWSKQLTCSASKSVVV
jgi:hypothetical protein